MTQKIDANRVSLLWANPEHAAEIATCHAPLFPEPWDAASFERLLENPGSTAFVARHGNPQATLGFIVGVLAADDAEILTIGVAKPYQRCGIARRLIDALARAAKKAEAKHLFLDVADDNIPALVLYSRLGFKEIGLRKGYYQRTSGPAVDALTLQLKL
jgi:[ribosomal protein S18]-alanine N-acetyltransferase